jgi:hypothetical protein
MPAKPSRRRRGGEPRKKRRQVDDMDDEERISVRLDRLQRILAAVAGIVVAISAIIKEVGDFPLPPLSWIAGDGLLGTLLLILGGLALLVTVLSLLGRHLPVWLRIAGLVVLYLVIAVLVARVFFWPAPSVSITAPQDGAVLWGPEQTVEGTSLGPVEDKLWIVVQVASPNPNGPKGYFPQEGPIPVAQDGRWKAQITVGDRNSAPGEAFVVLDGSAPSRCGCAAR